MQKSQAENAALSQYRRTGYTAGLTPKAFLVALWCREAIETLRRLAGTDRRKALDSYRKTEKVLLEKGPLTVNGVLACVKSAFLAVKGRPPVSADYAAEVATVAEVAEEVSPGLKSLVYLLAGSNGLGLDLSTSGKRATLYTRASREVNRLGRVRTDSMQKPLVTKALCRETPFGEALAEVILYLLRARQAADLFESLLTLDEAPEGTLAEACVDFLLLREGAQEVVSSFKDAAPSLYAANLQKAKEAAEKAKAEVARKDPKRKKATFRRSLDGGKTWTSETVTFVVQSKDRKRKRGIRTVSLEALRRAEAKEDREPWQD